MKRYAIVRVDNSCPAMLDDFGCIVARNMLYCKCGEDTKNYGDTKEQLIRKVAQIIFRKEMKWWKLHLTLTPNRKIDEPFIRCIYGQCLEQAKEIIEFLGVE